MCYETASGPEIHMLDPENIDAEEVKIKPVDVGIQTECRQNCTHPDYTKNYIRRRVIIIII